MEVLKEDISKLYTITQFAELMNVERRTVYNWMADPEKMREKKIAVVNISGKQFIKFV